MKAQFRAAEKLRQIRSVLQGRKCMLIVMQDNPDPDAIASSVALRELSIALAAVPACIAHGGIIGRAENRAIVRYLDLKLQRIECLDFSRFDIIAMVDTQPGSGNNSLPAALRPEITIDHHPMRNDTRRCTVTDIRRRYGATATILHEYMKAADLPISVPLATALLYGIRSDTQNLGRETTQADIDAFFSLYPVANKRMLSRIEWGPVPRDYFQLMAQALQNAKCYDHCIVAFLGEIDNPDMLGEVADLLLRDDGCTWTLCYGIHHGEFRLSVRTSESSADAGKVAHRIVGRKGSGGGHSASAAGRIPLTHNTSEERHLTERHIVKRFLEAAGAGAVKPTALVQLG